MHYVTAFLGHFIVITVMVYFSPYCNKFFIVSVNSVAF